LADRRLTLGLPKFGAGNGGSFRRIVQTPGGIAIAYDVARGRDGASGGGDVDPLLQ
jgi:hypothetical protein